ncbi:MAG: hypothetical protein RIQ90_148 [Bacteroidota bacterium]|jgi:tRNA U34 5-methylaminomethyl-2-thiouridine-forming methyltransferase MnmC
MNRTLIETADGSLTLFVPALNEHYHSTHGALQEANHVFIQNGVACKNHLDSIRILEMGLGTGINAFLTMAWAKSYLGMVTYVGIEVFPVEEFLIDSCLQAVGCEDPLERSFFSQASYGRTQELGNFRFFPRIAKWEEVDYTHEFDVVFYDAFGPRAQEEMWSMENLERAYHALGTGGLFTTYCAKGQVKRNLKALGFEVRSLPGPPGKREMTQAIKV